VDMLGWRTQGFYTSWAWNLLGIAFFLGGLIPLLIVRRHDSGMMMITGKEVEKIWIIPWLPRLALVTFEIAAPSAFLTSFIVTYGLWPQAYKQQLHRQSRKLYRKSCLKELWLIIHRSLTMMYPVDLLWDLGVICRTAGVFNARKDYAAH
jgi:hypothetical protein